MTDEFDLKRQTGFLIRPDRTPEGYRFSYIEPGSGMVVGPYEGETGVLEQAMDYGYEFLAKPNEKLGRSGPVCPFVRPSLFRNEFFLSVSDSDGSTPEEDIALILRLKAVLVAMGTEEANNIFRTILILFPNIEGDKIVPIVETVENHLRAGFVADGLMIGEFHPLSQVEGLHSSDFRPFQAPATLVAIRHMVRGDIVFLRGNPEFEREYYDRFPDESS